MANSSRIQKKDTNSQGQANTYKATESVIRLFDPNDALLFYGRHKALILNNTDEVTIKSPAPKIEIVVDPRLSKILTANQRGGVQKMYNHLSNLHNDFVGFVMADGPGDGKVLQCITVVWTFLTQSLKSSMAELKMFPMSKKAIILCKGNKVLFWKNCIRKYLEPLKDENPHSKKSMNLCVIEQESDLEKDMCRTFMNNSNPKQCLVISYEDFQKMAAEIVTVNKNKNGIVGMIVADDAEYIDDAGKKLKELVLNYPSKMRIVLTDLPFEKELSKYYSIIAFTSSEFETCFPRQNFQAEFVYSIKRYMKDKSYHGGFQASNRLKNWIRPFFLRRF